MLFFQSGLGHLHYHEINKRLQNFSLEKLIILLYLFSLAVLCISIVFTDFPFLGWTELRKEEMVLCLYSWFHYNFGYNLSHCCWFVWARDRTGSEFGLFEALSFTAETNLTDSPVDCCQLTAISLTFLRARNIFGVLCPLYVRLSTIFTLCVVFLGKYSASSINALSVEIKCSHSAETERTKFCDAWSQISAEQGTSA